jgi:RNA polymerase sigma factor (sigma-70 family)
MVVASGEVRLPKFLRREAGVEVDRLYRRYADEVFRYALMVMRSRPDAEDITQTVFIRALRAVERGEKVRTPRNWLIKIAHNECRRLLASRKVHVELPEEIAVEPVERPDVAELRTAMAGLPEAQRKALCLRELEGRTYVEIASELDLTVSAVETLIFRARRTLREQIEAAISCQDFALLLDDPSARARIRAHARVCPECATLERQARGRKSALKRIASMLGLPWWGTKLAAVGLTAAAVAASAASVHALVPHHGARSHASTPSKVAPGPVVAPHSTKVSGTPRVSGTGATGRMPHARAAAAGSVTRRSAPGAPTPLPQPAPEPPAPSLPPAAQAPAEAAAASPSSASATAALPTPAPVAIPSVAPPAVTVSTPVVSTPAVPVAPPPVETPPVTVPAVTTPVATTPAVTVPSVTVSVPTATVPSVTTTITTPNVRLP